MIYEFTPLSMLFTEKTKRRLHRAAWTVFPRRQKKDAGEGRTSRAGNKMRPP